MGQDPHSVSPGEAGRPAIRVGRIYPILEELYLSYFRATNLPFLFYISFGSPHIHIFGLGIILFGIVTLVYFIYCFCGVIWIV